MAGERDAKTGVELEEGGTDATDARSFTLRDVLPELRRRYAKAGHWNDDTLGALLHRLIGANPRLAFRIWSRTRPFQDDLGGIYTRALRVAAGLRRLGVGPGDVGPDLSSLCRHLEAEGLARQKWPEELRVLNDFPRTPSGKIVEAELRRRLREATA